MNYQHINTGIEKGLEEEELAITLPPFELDPDIDVFAPHRQSNS